MVDLLDAFSKKQINQFGTDFLELLRVALGMDKLYEKATGKLTDYMSRYKSLVELFNKKYKGMEVKIAKTTEELNLMILLNEKNLKDLFKNAAARISGLKSIGTNTFDEVNTDDGDRFSNKMASIENELYLNYYYPKKSSDSFCLKSKHNMVQIIFDPDIIKDELSPEFKLCAYYALKEGFEEGIDFFSQAASFGFMDTPTEKGLKRYKERFDPTYLE